MLRFARPTIGLAIAVIAILCGTTTRADILVPLPAVEVPTDSNVTNLSYDVPLIITAPDDSFDSFGYGIRFRVVPQAGATGSVTITGGGEAASNPAFGDGEISFTTQAGGLEAFAQAFNVSAQNLDHNSGLFSFNLTIAPDTLGTFALEFFDAPGEPTSIFDNAGGTVGSINFTGGQVAVTPEPTSMALLAVGAMCLVMRRRRPAA